MLLDSVSVARRLPLALLVCGVEPACGAASATAPMPGEQKSDLVLSQRKQERGWIGILVATDDGNRGVQVVRVVPDSPAAQAGIAPGDTLLLVGRHPIAGAADFVAEIRASKPGATLLVGGLRAGEERTFEVAVESTPDENAVLERMFVGRQAPSLDGLVPIDERATPGWDQLHGHVVVLDFWAPWCGVCHLVANDLNRWQASFGDRVQVLGVSSGPVEEVKQFAPRFRMQYAVAADPLDKVAKGFAAPAVPLVVVIDPSGVVRAITMGYSSARMAAMERLLEQLVSKQ